MEYLVQETYPKSVETVVTEKELPEVYARLKDSAVTWNRDGDEVLIVGVGTDHSVITLKSEETFYWLTVSDDDEEVYVDMGGIDSEVPRKALAPRELGLTVLLRVHDRPGLRADYTWCEQ